MACLRPLGDALASAFNRVGLTTEQVERWLGSPCGCEERRERLNQLDAWLRRSARETADTARDLLADLLELSL